MSAVPDPTLTLGARVVRLREARGLALEALANESGVAVKTLYNIEHGQRANPQLSTLARISDALGVTIGDLVGSEPLPALAPIQAVAVHLVDSDVRVLAGVAAHIAQLRQSREDVERARARVLALFEHDETAKAALREMFALEDEQAVAPRENPVSYPAQT